MSSLQLESLQKAIMQFEQGIKRAGENPIDELLRDGVIQRFEYTMDLAWKYMQRYLKVDLQIDEMSIRSKKDLFRESARLNIISNAENWFAHYEARNQTSHDYDAQKANAVYKQALLFLPDVKEFLAFLENDV